MTATRRKGTTVGDRLADNAAWQKRIHDNDDSYATVEWKSRALARACEEERVLDLAKREVGAGGALPTLTAVAHGDTSAFFDDVERWAILWQYRQHLALGEFTGALLNAASEADEKNLDRLARGFPELVAGIRRWRNESHFSIRIEALLDRT